MELTQLQWQNPGQITPVVGQPINIGSNSDNQIVHQNLVNNAAQITQWLSWENLIKPMVRSSPVIVNWQKIWWPTQIQHWDTIWVWENNDILLWVNKPWAKLDPWAVKKHLWNMNFSSEQINEITKRLFDVKENKIIQTPLFVLWWIIIFLIIWVVYWFFEFSKLNTDLASKASDINKKITQANATIENIEWILWVSLDLDCDPLDAWCGSSKSLDSKISDLATKITSFNKKVSSVEGNITKLKAELKTIWSSIEWEWVNIIKKEVEKDLNDGPIKTIKSDLAELKGAFDKLDKVLWNVVDWIKDDVKELSKYSADLKSLKEVSGFMKNYETNKALVDKKITLSEEEIRNIKNSISSLLKKSDSLDSDLKRTNEEISSLELKIRNIDK